MRTRVVDFEPRCYIVIMKSLLPRRRLLSAIRVLIALLLFGQATLLAQACTLPKAAASMLQAGPSHGAMPCCKHMSANACLSQMTQADEAMSSIPAAAPPLGFALPVLTVAVAKPSNPSVASSLRIGIDFHEPPPAVRFCSFQT